MSKKLFNQFICSRMMLPEHREKLKEYREKVENEEKYRLPLFDEHLLAEFQFLLNKSSKNNVKIQITILTKEGYEQIRGVVQEIDPALKRITIATEDGLKKLALKGIVSIEDK